MKLLVNPTDKEMDVVNREFHVVKSEKYILHKVEKVKMKKILF
ncbi:hypothetical protein [uncultured Tenacibaculum sp.]|nr:hypothetical protein [uncultured Tenacibaculum sp.]